MVEKDLEKRIVEKIRGLGMPDVGVFGLWSDSTSMFNNKEHAD